jgi:putative UDP-glucose 4-epimerase
LITGASGTVGYGIYQYLSMLSFKYRIITTARQQIPESREHIVFDFLTENFEQFFSVFGVDIIIHCAAVIPSSAISTATAAAINEKIDAAVFGYCSKYHRIKLLFFSTASLYNLKGNTVHTEDVLPVENLEGYLSEKFCTEKLAFETCKNFVVFRITSPYSLLQRQNNVLKIFVENAFFKREITYFGLGTRTQDFIHVTDIARAVECALSFEGKDVFNIASGMPITMCNLAHLIAEVAYEVCGMDINIQRSIAPDPQELYRVNISIEKAARLLGWEPYANLCEELKRWFCFLLQSN